MNNDSPWLTTFTGRHFHFMEPVIDEIDIMDIAVALSREGRFAGHCWDYYSVAQHSVHVSEKMEQIMRNMGMIVVDSGYEAVDTATRKGDLLVAKLSLCGLLHDASEAYLKDMPSPIKDVLPKYQAMEAKMMDVIMEKHSLKELWNFKFTQKYVKKVDKAVMACEVRDLIKHKQVWHMPEPPYPDLVIKAVPPDTAAVQFLARYSTLIREIELAA